jgi:hypothetical protein
MFLIIRSTLLQLATVATSRKSLWPRTIGSSLLNHRYSGSLVATGRRCSSLLWILVATGVLTSAHPLPLDRKHNMYLVCKRRHNLKQNISSSTSNSYKSCSYIQRVDASNNSNTHTHIYIYIYMASDHWRSAYGLWCSRCEPSNPVFKDRFHSVAQLQ